jgi:hypothetical protein
MTIPVTIIGDTEIRGFDEKQLRAALGLSGRP